MEPFALRFKSELVLFGKIYEANFSAMLVNGQVFFFLCYVYLLVL